MNQSEFYIQQNKNLIVSMQGQQYLYRAANWAKFIAILGFSIVFIVAMGTYILGLIMSNASKVPSESQSDVFMLTTISTVIFIAMVIMYFYALSRIFKFSNSIKQAIKTDNPETLTEAFMYLYSHYKSMGIMMIAGLSAYLLMSIGMGIFMVYAMGVLINTF